MPAHRFALLGVLAVLTGCAAVPPRSSTAELEKQVADTERAFAKTMADRNYAGFGNFLSDETIFYSSPTTPLRGKPAVMENWKRFYEQPEAPFSWGPEQVQVLESGTLAISSGPVRNPQGKHFANFSSIWRLEAPGVWRVIFDKGNVVCDCVKP
ncbi:MAG: nuclear transport factor 2 family protein [Betaproteobacteria bacterium]